MFMSGAIDINTRIIFAFSAANLLVLAVISIPTFDILADIVFADLLVVTMIVTCAVNRLARISDASFFFSAVVVCSAGLPVARI